MRKWILAFISTTLLMCFGTTLCMAAEVASGTCGKDGNNLTWVLDDEGTLTISGTREMDDY